MIRCQLLNFACEHIFEKIEEIIRERKGKKHEVCLKSWNLMKKENREISLMFDHLRRRNTIHKLAAWKRNGVISNESFSAFSDETKQTVGVLNEDLR
ncbi:MAG: hypothetical protein ACE10E_07895 [Acidiferrobacterales bacterium]|nr:hypothetical protein [bacterium]